MAFELGDAERYRRKASDIRAALAREKPSIANQMLQDVADEYERMARMIETLHAVGMDRNEPV
jgi:hypothetical protein